MVNTVVRVRLIPLVLKLAYIEFIVGDRQTNRPSGVVYQHALAVTLQWE